MLLWLLLLSLLLLSLSLLLLLVWGWWVGVGQWWFVPLGLDLVGWGLVGRGVCWQV